MKTLRSCLRYTLVLCRVLACLLRKISPDKVCPYMATTHLIGLLQVHSQKMDQLRDVERTMLSDRLSSLAALLGDSDDKARSMAELERRKAEDEVEVRIYSVVLILVVVFGDQARLLRKTNQ